MSGRIKASKRTRGKQEPKHPVPHRRSPSPINLHQPSAPGPTTPACTNSQVVKNASCGLLNPYVLLTPIGSQMMQSKKSKIMRPIENLNTAEYIRAVKSSQYTDTR